MAAAGSQAMEMSQTLDGTGSASRFFFLSFFLSTRRERNPNVAVPKRSLSFLNDPPVSLLRRHACLSTSVLAALHEISRLVNAGVDKQTLAILVSLCEQGVNPEALAAVVLELRREAAGATSAPEKVRCVFYSHSVCPLLLFMFSA